MRIIAGEFRGRKLLPPATEATRPITDRVKQSLFDVLARLEGAVVYDCFAGTGSMGLEALSRGAAHATFFESDRSALTRLRQNIDALGLGPRSTVIPSDLFRWFSGNRSPDRASMVFLDPPYRFLRMHRDALRKLAQDLTERFLHPNGIVVFRHDAADSLDLPSLKAFDTRTYGKMTIELLSQDTPAPIG